MNKRQNFWLARWTVFLAMFFAIANFSFATDIYFVEKVIDSNLPSAFTVDAADIDGDGDIDVLAGGQNGNLNLYVNNGSGSFSKRAIASHYGSVWSVEAFDINRDGRMDIIAAVSHEEDIVWWKNNGGTNFTRYIVDNNMVSAEDVAAGDLDGDGDIDMVGFGWNDTTPCRWYENDGSEHFSIHVLDYSFLWAHFVAVADFNHDGDLDIVGTNGNGISWWKNSGNGSFSKRVISSNFSGAYCAQPADLDEDGNMDVIGAAHNINTVAWFKNSGGGNFSKRILTSDFSETHDAYVGDIDGDGDQDFVATSRALNGVAWFENRGDETFIEHMISTNVKEAQTVCLGDLDGDGDLDVISEARRGDKVVWWENRGGAVETISIPDVPAGPSEGLIDEILSFSTGGAHSNLGHSVEYQFSWGDGTYSAWGAATGTHSYSSTGTYAVKARARCVTHTSKVSGWSNSHNVTISEETVSVPNRPDGPSTGVVGEAMSFTTGGAVSSVGHDIEYQFDWGDGVSSSWGDANRSHQYSSIGSYNIRSRARCQTHTDIVSNWSSAHSVTINPKTYQISGTVNYYSSSEPVQNVSVNMSGDVSGFDDTDNAGHYSFTVEEYSDIVLKATKERYADVGHLTISMYDAALAAQAALSLISLSEDQTLAADVDKNGILYTFDAALIAQYAVGFEPPSTSHVGEWDFLPDSIDIENIQNDHADPNFRAFVIGDVDGGWSPSSRLTKETGAIDNKNVFAETEERENEVVVKIGLNSDKWVLSCDIDFQFDPEKVEFSRIDFSKLGSDFRIFQHSDNGRVQVGFFALKEKNMQGEIVRLHFKKKTNYESAGMELKRFQVNNFLLAENKILERSATGAVKTYVLEQNFPNPFNSSTLIEYSIFESGRATLVIYNVFGQRVRTLVNAFQNKGNYRIAWDGMDDEGRKVSGGVYLYQLNINNFKFTRKMLIIE